MTTTSHYALEVALTDAVHRALCAPSALNSQPWTWRIGPRSIELRADHSRQLTTVDPKGHLLLLGCGAALHHARVSLAAAGWRAETDRFPDPGESDLLARVRAVESQAPDRDAVRLRDAIAKRRTDRRAFEDTPVLSAALDRLRSATEREGAFLHVVNVNQIPMLAIATMKAAGDELADPAYRSELTRWTNRPPWSGDGVPAEAAVQRSPRRVPMRDHALGGWPGLAVGTGNDRGAAYTILYGKSDEPAGWLRAGEALSALSLTAVAEGLSTAPISDPIEVGLPRQLLRELLAGAGQPYLVVRIGVGADPDGLPQVPRRDPAEVIDRTTQ